MPILGSFGTANDRAFGFCDSAFSNGYDLPASITNNALMILDASNPDSFSNRSNYTVTPLVHVFNSSSVSLGGGDYFIPVPANSNIMAGDGLSYPGWGYGVSRVDRNVWMSIDGNSYFGDRVVVHYPPAWGNAIITVTPDNKIWHDISGNNHNATWSSTPTLSGGGANKYLTATSGIQLSIPEAASNSFDYLIVSKATGGGWNVKGNAWQSQLFLQEGSPYFVSYGSGSDTRNGPLSDYSPVSSWALYHVGISGGSATTHQGGRSTWYQSSRDYGGTQHSAATIGTTMGVSDSMDIKFIAVYAGGTGPSVTTAYNALHSRFGL